MKPSTKDNLIAISVGLIGLIMCITAALAVVSPIKRCEALTCTINYAPVGVIFIVGIILICGTICCAWMDYAYKKQKVKKNE